MKKCKSCQSEIDSKAKKCPHCQADQRNWFARHPIITGILALIVIFGGIGALANSNSSNTSSQSASGSTNTQTSTQTTQPTTAPVRQVKGKVTTLGAGTFTGGKDVPVGLYDVTPGAGQSGNFIVTGTDSYDEILGGDSTTGGVPKTRVQISNGDSIQISGLSSVTFTPVTAPFVTSHSLVTLYAGTFTVGQDIGSGRYVATPGTGQSGNFIVSGNDSYDEILGGDSATGGVPKLTVNLTDGDVITISGLNQVTMTPQ